MLWLVGSVGTILFVKIDIETRRKECKWAQAKGEDEKNEAQERSDRSINLKKDEEANSEP